MFWFLRTSTCLLEVRHTQSRVETSAFHYASSTRLRSWKRLPQQGETIAITPELRIIVREVRHDDARNESFRRVPRVIADFYPPNCVAAALMEELGYCHDHHEGRHAQATPYDDAH